MYIAWPCRWLRVSCLRSWRECEWTRWGFFEVAEKLLLYTFFNRSTPPWYFWPRRMGCFWPLTASMTSEIKKKNHAHVYPYRNLCKFSEINLSISNKIRNIGPITSKPINIYKQGIDAAWNNTHCFEACKNPVNPENSWKFHKFYYWISPNSFEDRQQLFWKIGKFRSTMEIIYPQKEKL